MSQVTYTSGTCPTNNMPTSFGNYTPHTTTLLITTTYINQITQYNTKSVITFTTPNTTQRNKRESTIIL